MGNSNTTYMFIVGGGFSLFTYLIGGLDNLILSLAIMMGVDFVSGVMVGGKNGYEQSLRQRQTGVAEAVREGISSRKAYNGLIKKTAMLLAVIVAVRLDSLMGNDGNFMRNAIIMCFIGTEGISFCENLGKLGVSLPKNFVRMFSQLTQEEDEPPQSFARVSSPPIQEEDKPPMDLSENIVVGFSPLTEDKPPTEGEQ